MVTEAIRKSHYTYRKISELSGVPLPTIKAWVGGVTTPSAQKAVDVLCVIGIIKHHNVRERIKEAKGKYSLVKIEKVSGIPLSSLQNYLYYGTMPSYQTYMDYMETIDILNAKNKPQ